MKRYQHACLRPQVIQPIKIPKVWVTKPFAHITWLLIPTVSHRVPSTRQSDYFSIQSKPLLKLYLLGYETQVLILQSKVLKLKINHLAWSQIQILAPQKVGFSHINHAIVLPLLESLAVIAIVVVREPEHCGRVVCSGDWRGALDGTRDRVCCGAPFPSICFITSTTLLDKENQE